MDSREKLPRLFLERLRLQFDSDRCERILAGMSSPRVTGFRVNHLKSGENDPLVQLRADGLSFERATFATDAAWVVPELRQKLLFSSAYVEKRIYVQNLASMLPVLELAPEPGERILDLAAAPGSKTLQIAALTGNAGELAAVDVSRKRFFRMKANLSDFGADLVRTFLKDGSNVWRSRPEYFDRVLLDAPCASEGRFLTNDPESYQYWTPKKSSEMVRKQQRLLFSAVQSVIPGGVVVYSTCSLSAEENERVVSKMLDRFGGALRTEALQMKVDEMVQPMTEWRGKGFHEGVDNARRILPSRFMEGFFICKIRKTESTLD